MFATNVCHSHFRYGETYLDTHLTCGVNPGVLVLVFLTPNHWRSEHIIKATACELETLCELEHEDLESSLVFTHYSKGVFPSFFVNGFSIAGLNLHFPIVFPQFSYDSSIQTSVSQRIRSVPVQSQLLVPAS